MTKVFVLGGLSGSGKDTALKLLTHRGVVRKGVTCTTRKPRPGEVDGVDYEFMTPEQWRIAEWNDELAEKTVYIGNPVSYGITWRRIEEARQSTIPTVFILDSIGLTRLRELFPGQVLGLFLWAQPEVLAYRMRQRGESDETVARRLDRYDEETMLGIKRFDAVLDTGHMHPEQVADQLWVWMENGLPPRLKEQE